MLVLVAHGALLEYRYDSIYSRCMHMHELNDLIVYYLLRIVG